MNRRDIIQASTEYFEGCGYGIKEPSGLLNPRYPDTFNPCAGHTGINELANAPSLDHVVRWVAIEPVFRHLDAQKVGTSLNHVSCFDMLTHVDARNKAEASKEEVIQNILAYLRTLGLDQDRLRVTVFDGCELAGISVPPDQESRSILERLMGYERVFPLASPSNIEFLAVEGEQVGPRCEIFYQGDDLFEIGTAVFDAHVHKLACLMSRGLLPML